MSQPDQLPAFWLVGCRKVSCDWSRARAGEANLVLESSGPTRSKLFRWKRLRCEAWLVDKLLISNYWRGFIIVKSLMNPTICAINVACWLRRHWTVVGWRKWMSYVPTFFYFFYFWKFQNGFDLFLFVTIFFGWTLPFNLWYNLSFTFEVCSAIARNERWCSLSFPAQPCGQIVRDGININLKRFESSLTTSIPIPAVIRTL